MRPSASPLRAAGLGGGGGGWLGSLRSGPDASRAPRAAVPAGAGRGPRRGWAGGGGGEAPLHPELLSRILDREWLLDDPRVRVTRVRRGATGRWSAAGAAAREREAGEVGPSARPGAGPSPLPSRTLYYLRDDLLHPFLNGNKLRKLDGSWRAATRHSSAVVLAGGLQSSAAAAVAAIGAAEGVPVHLVLRGERPRSPTGPYVVSSMMATRVKHVSRAEFSDRTVALATAAAEAEADPTWEVAAGAEAGGHPGLSGLGPRACSVGGDGLRTSDGGGRDEGPAPTSARPQVSVLPEGIAVPSSLFGFVRLLRELTESEPDLAARPATVVVDSGTGATAAGLALGVVVLGLPWRVLGVAVGAGPSELRRQAEDLLRAALRELAPGDERSATGHPAAGLLELCDSTLSFSPRLSPRKFGRVHPGDVAACRRVARATGVLLDPVWTLAAWEIAEELVDRADLDEAAGAAAREEDSKECGGAVVVLHTGGALGLFPAAQRWPTYFNDA